MINEVKSWWNSVLKGEKRGLIVLAAVVCTMALTEYQAVKSWPYQRELMIAKIKSDAEADSSIARSMATLMDMYRSAVNDRIGVATAVLSSPAIQLPNRFTT